MNKWFQRTDVYNLPILLSITTSTVQGNFIASDKNWIDACYMTPKLLC